MKQFLLCLTIGLFLTVNLYLYLADAATGTTKNVATPWTQSAKIIDSQLAGGPQTAGSGGGGC